MDWMCGASCRFLKYVWPCWILQFRNPRFEDQLANRVVPEGCIIEAAIHSKLGIPKFGIQEGGFLGKCSKNNLGSKI